MPSSVFFSMPLKINRGGEREQVSRVGRGPRGGRAALLIKFLVVKSIIDVLFVGVLAASYDLRVFNPYLRGSVDDAGPEWVRGWVVDQSAPGERVEVQLYIDGRFADSRAADSPRPDLVAAGVAEDERHSFFFYTPPLEPGEHEARVYAVHRGREGNRRALHLLGRPLRFTSEDAPLEPHFRGWLDEANPVTVRGWVVSRERPDAAVEVHLYVDGRFVEGRATDQARADLAAAGLRADNRHGFIFFTPALTPGEHEARVYALREGGEGQGRSLRLVGRPQKFEVPESGVILAPKGAPADDEGMLP